MPYHLDKLIQDLEQTREWLADEERRSAASSDPELKKILGIRCNMHRRNIQELETAIKNLTPTSKENSEVITKEEANG